MLKQTKRPETGMGRPILHLGGDDPRNILTLRHCYENIMCLGTTGGGKTSSVLASLMYGLLDKEGLAENEKCGMVICLHKDDAEVFREWIWQQGRDDDLEIVSASDKNVYNFLAAYQEEEPLNAVNALMNISSLSAGDSNKQGDAFWEVMARKYIDRLVRLTQISGEPLNVDTLHRLFTSAPSYPEQVTEEFIQKSFMCQTMEKAAARVGDNHPDFQLVDSWFFGEAINMAQETISSIKAHVSSVLEPYVSSELLRNFFSGDSNLDLDDIFKGKILLLDIPVSQHEFAGRIAQVTILYALMKAAEKRNLKTNGNPFFFIMDEAQVFLTKHHQAFMSVSRSANCGTLILSQNLPSIMAVLGGGPHGDARVKSLAGLCNTKIFLANNDPSTANFCAESCGKAFIDVATVSIGDKGSSASSAKRFHYLVEPRQLFTLRTGGPQADYMVDAIVVATGRKFSTGTNFLHTSFRQYFTL